MSRNDKIKARHKEIREEIDANAHRLGIKPAKLRERYFKERIDEEVDSEDIHLFHDRCKKKSAPTLVDIERLSPILAFSRELLSQSPRNKPLNDENIQFAYAMHEAFLSRFLCANTLKPVGCIKTAGESLRDLFVTHRRLTEKHGHLAKQAASTVRDFLDAEIRPFTTKWHPILLKINNENMEQYKADYVEELTPIKQAASYLL